MRQRSIRDYIVSQLTFKQYQACQKATFTLAWIETISMSDFKKITSNKKLHKEMIRLKRYSIRLTA